MDFVGLFEPLHGPVVVAGVEILTGDGDRREDPMDTAFRTSPDSSYRAARTSAMRRIAPS